MKQFDTYWEYLLRQSKPWARLINILVTPVLLIMMIAKGVATNQPYFWIGAIFAAVMCVQQHVTTGRSGMISTARTLKFN